MAVGADEPFLMVVFLAEKKAMIFVAAQMIAHDLSQQINQLVNFFLAHPRNELLGEAVGAEQAEKGDQGLFVGGAIESEKHGGSSGGN